MHGIDPITKPVLANRTREYQQWVEAYARHHRIPIHWPDPNLNKKDLKKEEFVRPYGLATEQRKRFGVSFIFKSLEQDPTFGSLLPKYPTGDPDYRILKRNGPPARTTTSTSGTKCSALWPCVSVLPFPTTDSIHGPFHRSAGRAYASAKTITAFYGPRTRQPCRHRPTAAARK